MIIGKEVRWRNGSVYQSGHVLDKVSVVVGDKAGAFNTDAYLVEDGTGGEVSVVFPQDIATVYPEDGSVEFSVGILRKKIFIREKQFETLDKAKEYTIEIEGAKDYHIVQIFKGQNVRQLYVWDGEWKKLNDQEWTTPTIR